MTSLTNISSELFDLSKETTFHLLLQKIQTECDILSKIAISSDYDENIPYNGVRTLLKIVQKYYYLVHSFLLLYKHKLTINNNVNLLDENENIRKIQRESKLINSLHIKVIKSIPESPLTEYLDRLSNIPTEQLADLYKDLCGMGKYFLYHFDTFIKPIHEKTDLVDFGDGLSAPEYFKRMFPAFSELQFDHVGSFFNPHIVYFWVTPIRRRIISSYYSLLFMWISPIRSSFKWMFDHKFRQKNHFNLIRRTPPCKFLHYASIIDNKILRSLVSSTTSMYYSCSYKYFEVPRQKKYGFDTKTGYLNTNCAPIMENQTKSIYCSYISNGVTNFSNDSLIFHSFGSAFCGLNSHIHAPYLTKWVNKLNIPILTPDYSKAPKHPFPYALQDLLDVYLFITDSDNRSLVEELLGFFPRKILLFGDSAGGNLALALMVAINELNKSYSNGKIIPLPTSMILLYPCSSPVIIGFYSGSFISIDAFYTPSIILNCAMSYLNPEEASSDSHVWYEKANPNFDSCIKQMLKFNRNPFISPLNYQHLHDFKDINLFVQIGEYDILLDDSINIAKAWKGPTKLDIVPNETHAYVGYSTYPETLKHIDVLHEFIVENLSKNNVSSS